MSDDVNTWRVRVGDGGGVVAEVANGVHQQCGKFGHPPKELCERSRDPARSERGVDVPEKVLVSISNIKPSKYWQATGRPVEAGGRREGRKAAMTDRHIAGRHIESRQAAGSWRQASGRWQAVGRQAAGDKEAAGRQSASKHIKQLIYRLSISTTVFFIHIELSI